MQRGAIILCGGKSTRMGQEKASLPIGAESMLGRVVRLLGEAVPLANMVIVARENQPLPPLPPLLRIAFDQHPNRGPLEGLAAGLRAVASSIDAVYVTSCDVPLLVPAFVTEMFNRLGNYDAVVPCEDALYHPLAAVYRVQTLTAVERLLAADRLRTSLLFGEVRTLEVPVDELRAVDPELRSLRNINHPDEYQAALAAANRLVQFDPTSI